MSLNNGLSANNNNRILARVPSFVWKLSFLNKIKPSQEHSRGYTRFPNQNFRQISKGVSQL